MNAELGTRNAELKERTFDFSLRIIRLVESLPKTGAAQVIGRQLVRAGTSVGANYRAARRARSRAEFVAKLGIVEEECDEIGYWLDLLAAGGFVTGSRLAGLRGESDELLAIVIASIKTARKSR